MIPNHILILGSPHTGKLRISELVLKGAKSADIQNESHSGIIIKTDLKTKYYEAQLNILIDEYPSTREEKNGTIDDDDKHGQLQKWFEEFKLAECKELRDVLDGLIFTVNIDSDSIEYMAQCMDTLNDLKLLMEEESNGDIFLCVIGVSKTTELYEDYEDLAIQNGLEFIYWLESGENEFKDKIGRDRLMEILETHDWKNFSDVTHDDEYKQHKMERMNDEMLQSLISPEGEPSLQNEDISNPIDKDKNADERIDLTDLLLKLKLAREQATKVNDDQQREAYVKNVIEDIIDYI